MIRFNSIVSCLLVLLLAYSAKTVAQERGVFTAITNIGNPKLKGSTILAVSARKNERFGRQSGICS
jgi:hypothetical protein